MKNVEVIIDWRKRKHIPFPWNPSIANGSEERSWMKGKEMIVTCNNYIGLPLMMRRAATFFKLEGHAMEW